MVEKKQKRKGFLKNNRGVSLIEVLIAVAIFAIGISAVAVLQYKTVSGNTRGRMITDATTLAEREMERLMELPDDHTDLAPNPSPLPSVYQAPYTVTWDVTPVDLNLDGADESKQIEITVTAPQFGGNKDIFIVFFKDNLKPS